MRTNSPVGRAGVLEGARLQRSEDRGLEGELGLLRIQRGVLRGLPVGVLEGRVLLTGPRRWRAPGGVDAGQILDGG